MKDSLLIYILSLCVLLGIGINNEPEYINYRLGIKKMDVLSDKYILETTTTQVKTDDGWESIVDTFFIDEHVVNIQFEVSPKPDDYIPIAYEAFCPACNYKDSRLDSILAQNPAMKLSELMPSIKQTVVVLEDENHRLKTFNDWNIRISQMLQMEDSELFEGYDTVLTDAYGVNRGYYKCEEARSINGYGDSFELSFPVESHLALIKPEESEINITFLVIDLKVRRWSKKVKIHYFFVPGERYSSFSEHIHLESDWVPLAS